MAYLYDSVVLCQSKQFREDEAWTKTWQRKLQLASSLSSPLLLDSSGKRHRTLIDIDNATLYRALRDGYSCHVEIEKEIKPGQYMYSWTLYLKSSDGSLKPIHSTPNSCAISTIASLDGRYSCTTSDKFHGVVTKDRPTSKLILSEKCKPHEYRTILGTALYDAVLHQLADSKLRFYGKLVSFRRHTDGVVYLKRYTNHVDDIETELVRLLVNEDIQQVLRRFIAYYEMDGAFVEETEYDSDEGDYDESVYFAITLNLVEKLADLSKQLNVENKIITEELEASCGVKLAIIRYFDDGVRGPDDRDIFRVRLTYPECI